MPAASERGPRAVPRPPGPTGAAAPVRVAAVVPAHQGRAWLPACLAALRGQRGAGFARVVVVDDASTDGTAEWLAAAHPDVALVARAGRGGFARAANAGLWRAAGLGCDAVALVNTDVELAADWLERVLAALGPRDASVACKMVALHDPGAVDDAGDVLRRDGAAAQRGRGRRDAGQWDDAGAVWGACGGAALYRVAPLVEAEGFDEELGQYLEDVDLALRLRLGGWDCAYAPALAHHAGGGSSSALRAPVRFWVARNTLLIVATWFPVRWWPAVAYRNASWLVAAAREGRAALGWQLRGVLAGLRAGARRLPGRGRRRRAAPRGIAAAVPATPWRGPGASGHPRGGE